MRLLTFLVVIKLSTKKTEVVMIRIRQVLRRINVQWDISASMSVGRPI